jgi:hypothetical protein
MRAPRAPGPDMSHFEKQSDAERSAELAVNNPSPPIFSPGTMSGYDLDQDEEVPLREDVRPGKMYNNAQFQQWIEEYLPVLVRIFKNKFHIELDQLERPYPDAQIAAACEHYCPILWNIGNDGNPITQQQMNTWVKMVRDHLFKQQPEPEQPELFSESLSKAYERNLNSIVGIYL